MCLWEDTFTYNNWLCDGFNWPSMGLFSTVDVVAKQRYVKQTMESAKSVSFIGRDMKFSNNFIINR